MIVWGAAMPLVGLAPGHPEGWLLLGLLGLFSGVFESIQVIRDHDEDAAAQVRTTAVVLGVARARVLVRGLMVVAAIYVAVAFSPWIAVLPVLAVLIPIELDRLDRYWNRVRIVLGVTMLIATAIVWFGGHG
jgi:4-hydroxybenzoate polyprenyltransferase